MGCDVSSMSQALLVAWMSRARSLELARELRPKSPRCREHSCLRLLSQPTLTMSDFNPMFCREAALKAFLKEEKIAFDKDDSLNSLRHRAVGRMKTKRRQERGGNSFAFGVADAAK